MALALQGVGLMAEYCAQCAKQYGMKNGFIGVVLELSLPYRGTILFHTYSFL